ncbi:hypothetical protein DH2020_049485 [Rehmannia glutinosa]|uniref:G-type lectin S-receptor-like serine/threonine-protein kinase n=1 Tax=Rehmannia glutinosa TaxID=99300 RepID=A0ABR0U2N0_REHGL
MRRTASRDFSLFLLIVPLIFLTIFSNATDTINADQTIKDGETLVSSGGKFELGFFSPGNSRNRYVGMWFRNITVTTIVWVANREAPITDNSGVLTVIRPGILVLLNNTNNNTVWSTNTSRTVQNPVAQLLDSGNFVVRDGEDDRPENFLWQSFEYPTDTYLPGMSLGWNFVTGKETYLSSWRSNDDPGTGPPNPREDPTYRLSFVMDEEKVYYRSDLVDGSFVSRYTMNQSGVSQRWTWVDRTRGWVIYFSMPADICDTYRLCGAYGSCNVGSSPSCGCLDERFVPRDPEGWVRADWSSGCVRRTNLSCDGDVFLRYSGIKLPDARRSWNNATMTLDECRAECLRNCSCMAYPQLDIRRRSGCLVWFDELIDIRTLSPDGQVIYIRMASSEAGKFETGQEGHSDLPFFDLSVILKATNHFSSSNKLGEGGFGPVYKGMLEEGQEIAVKRLSKESRQGLDKLKNEFIFIAKLQHRNLVRLLGCCIQGEENETKSRILDWQKRFNIINGTARGLLYLHQDSRLRIIHRDLKASNILLDSEMNPKISDFGLARSFGGNETEAKTHRVVGT